MQKQVQDALDSFADQYDATIISARDTGSRAYGVHGPDSDYDVRAICVSPPEQYARLDTPREDYRLHDIAPDVDLDVWDARKFCELLADSDPNALEFTRSSEIYQDSAVWHTDAGEAIQQLAGNPISVYHHYRGLAEGQYHKYLTIHLVDSGGERRYEVIEELGGDEYVVDALNGAPERETIPNDELDELGLRETTLDSKVKRKLYAMRGSLCARYVAETQSFPPMDLDRLADECRRTLTPLDADDNEVTTHRISSWVDGFEILIRQKRGDDVPDDVSVEMDKSILPPTEVDYKALSGDGPDRDLLDEFLDDTFSIAFGE